MSTHIFYKDGTEYNMSYGDKNKHHTSDKLLSHNSIGTTQEDLIQLHYIQEPVTTSMRSIKNFFEFFLLPLSVFVILLVVFLVLYVVKRFRASVHPQPKKTHTSVTLEIVWTVIPLFLIFLLMIPSFQLHKEVYSIPDDIGLNIDITGYQWFWEYTYNSGKDKEFTITSTILQKNATDLKEQNKSRQYALLSVDNPLVIPSGTNIKFNITSADVIHSWSVPQFGIKQDAVPGRINTTWAHVIPGKEGIYYGFCTELCGMNHAYMPIEIHVLTQEDFNSWIKEKQVS